MATEQAKKARSIAKGKFTRLNNRIAKAIAEDDEIEYIDETFNDLKEAWEDVQGKHEAYVKLLEEEDGDEEWISELDKAFSAMQKLRISLRKKQDESCSGCRIGSDREGQEIGTGRGRSQSLRGDKTNN